MLVLLITVLSLISIFCWSCFGYVYEDSDNKKGGIQFFLAIVFTAFSILMFFVQIIFSYGGYSVNSSHLPIHGICKIVYIEETEASDFNSDIQAVDYPTLIKLPDGQLRLLDLDQKMELGLVKVMPDYTLIPFLPNQTVNQVKE